MTATDLPREEVSELKKVKMTMSDGLHKVLESREPGNRTFSGAFGLVAVSVSCY